MAGKRRLGYFKPTVTRPPSPPVNPPRGPFKSDHGPGRHIGSGANGHRWRQISNTLDPSQRGGSSHLTRFLKKYVRDHGLAMHQNPPTYWCTRCFLIVGINGPDEADDSCVESQFRNMLEA